MANQSRYFKKQIHEMSSYCEKTLIQEVQKFDCFVIISRKIYNFHTILNNQHKILLINNESFDMYIIFIFYFLTFIQYKITFQVFKSINKTLIETKATNL